MNERGYLRKYSGVFPEPPSRDEFLDFFSRLSQDDWQDFLHDALTENPCIYAIVPERRDGSIVPSVTILFRELPRLVCDLASRALASLLRASVGTLSTTGGAFPEPTCRAIRIANALPTQDTTDALVGIVQADTIPDAIRSLAASALAAPSFAAHLPASFWAGCDLHSAPFLLPAVILALQHSDAEKALRLACDPDIGAPASIECEYPLRLAVRSLAMQQPYDHEDVLTGILVESPPWLRHQLRRVLDFSEFTNRQKPCVHDIPSGATRKLVAARKKPSGKMGQLCVVPEYYIGRKHYMAFARKVYRGLCEAVKAAEAERSLVPWDQLASYLDMGFFDFCYAPYFLTGPRAYLVDILQFGEVRYFAGVADRIQFGIHATPLADTSLPTRQRIVDALRQTTGFQVALCGETAASAEIVAALRDHPGLQKQVHVLARSADLRHWLSQYRAQGVVICDVGIAKEIAEMTPKELASFGYRDLGDADAKYETVDRLQDPHPLRFEFVPRLKTGFVYRAGDLDWRRTLASVVANHVDAPGFRDKWRDIGTDLRKYGIEPFEYDELRASLGVCKDTVSEPRSQAETVDRADPR